LGITYPTCVPHYAFVDAIVETRLALGDKLKACVRILGRDKSSTNRSPAHQSLLCSLPSVRVAQDVVNVVLDGGKELGPATLLDVVDGTFVEVTKEVRKDVNGFLVQCRRKWRQY